VDSFAVTDLIMTNSSTEFEIPQLSEYPEFAALIAKRGELATENKEVQAELRALAEALNNDAHGSRRQHRIAELLGDNSEPGKSFDPTRYAALQQRSDDLRIGREEIERRIDAARISVSRKICERLKAQHIDLARDIAIALLKAHEAHGAYQSFADTLNAENIAWSSLGPSQPSMLGGCANPQSPLAVYLREAAAMGAITTDEIPDELMWPPRNKVESVRALRERILPWKQQARVKERKKA
jgi:hypothetical protein